VEFYLLFRMIKNKSLKHTEIEFRSFISQSHIK
jgi:hypothetical protein